MTSRLAVVMTIVALSFSNTALAAEQENVAPAVKRPGALPALYAAFGAMQAWDIYSTSAALHAGAKESNRVAAPFVGNAGSMIGLKAATMASTIFFAERLWKTNKAGAVVMMVAINGASAAVSFHNMRNARLAKAR
jgi:hypothetical protein